MPSIFVSCIFSQPGLRTSCINRIADNEMINQQTNHLLTLGSRYEAAASAAGHLLTCPLPDKGRGRGLRDQLQIAK